MVAVQLLVSLVVRSFAAPVGIALAGSVAGLLLSSKGWGLWWPWALMSLASNANGGGTLAPAELVRFVGVVALFSIAASTICALMMSHAAATSE